MKKKLLKAIALSCAILMLLSAFVSCGTNGNQEDTTPDTTAAADVSEVETADPRYDEQGFLRDQLPDNLNYKDTTINILAWDDVEHEEFEAEQDGDTVLSAIYTRNNNVEKRLGVKLNYIRVKGNADHKTEWCNHVANSVKINAREFDIVAGYSLSVTFDASSGCLYNMLDPECEYLNFDNPWWSELLVKEGTLKGKLYFASGDISRNCLEMMYVCFCNTNILNNHNLDNPQELVETGDWTYETFMKYCEGIYEDNGDGKKDSSDTFGYMSSGIHVDPWFYGTGATICSKDAEGNIVPSDTFGGEKIINTVAMFQTLFYSSNDGIYTSSVEHQNAFGQGRLLFITERARVSHKVLANKYAFTDFIILPCPKYNKDQEKYITVLGNPFTLFGIAADNQNLSMASAVIECFASEGYRNVTPAVFEFSLKSRYSFDSVSSRLYDVIRANITYDIGRLFNSDLIGQSDFRNALSTQGSVWNATGRMKVLTTKCQQLNNKLDDLQ